MEKDDKELETSKEVGKSENESQAAPAEGETPPEQSEVNKEEIKEEPVEDKFQSEDIIPDEGDKPAISQVFKDFIEEKKKDEEREFQKESQEYFGNREQLNLWTDRILKLKEELPVLHEKSRELIDRANSIKDIELPEEVSKFIENRLQGINLILKMTSKLPEKMEQLEGEIVIEPGEIKTFDIDSVIDPALDDEKNIKSIKEHFEKLRDKNYSVIKKVRDKQESLKRNFRKFMDKQFFVIIDGVDNGYNYSREQKETFSVKYPDKASALEDWFSVYKKLESLFNKCLAKFNITLIVPRRGDPLDDYLHEPFDTEEDPELPNEHVKELMRKGYEDDEKLPSGKNYVIRCAQIIVVKN